MACVVSIKRLCFDRYYVYWLQSSKAHMRVFMLYLKAIWMNGCLKTANFPISIKLSFHIIKLFMGSPWTTVVVAILSLLSTVSTHSWVTPGHLDSQIRLTASPMVTTRDSFVVSKDTSMLTKLMSFSTRCC